MTLSWSQQEWGESQAIITEINENELIPWISRLSNDTFPTNYPNSRMIIWGENFTPNTSIEIAGTSNLIYSIISPSEIEINFSTGSITGDFPIIAINGTKSSLLWGNTINLHIIAPVGGYLPLLDTWIDCRLGGSSDAMIGAINKDSISTWNRGIFGYGLSSMSSYPSTWLHFWRLSDYKFSIDLNLQTELILYFGSMFSNFRWGLHVKDTTLSTVSGFQVNPNSSYFHCILMINTATELLQFMKYNAPGLPLNSYVKIIFRRQYIGLFRVNIDDFSTGQKINETFFSENLWDEMMGGFKRSGFLEYEIGCKFLPGGSNPSNNSFLTAFKISWAS